MRSGAAVVFLLLVVACHRPQQGPPAVAIFGQEKILATDLKSELDRIRIESEQEVKLEGESLAALRRAVLSDLIDHRLLLAEATKAGVTVSDRELDEYVQRQNSEVKPETAAAQAEALSPEAFRNRVRERLVIERFLIREVAARVALRPEEARAYYDAHPDEFKRSEQVRVSQILVPKREANDVEAKKQADALKVMLNRNDFAKLAREQSAAPEAIRGGDLGWFGQGQMPPEFEEACFKLKKGQISDVVETSWGYHLFKLVDRRDGAKVPFPEAERKIELQLKREAVSKAQTAFLEKLRQRAGVQIVDTEVDKVL
jgi:peptidyl-prolyl cis-trans isomerase C/foldase protein PrsA